MKITEIAELDKPTTKGQMRRGSGSSSGIGACNPVLEEHVAGCVCSPTRCRGMSSKKQALDQKSRPDVLLELTRGACDPVWSAAQRVTECSADPCHHVIIDLSNRPSHQRLRNRVNTITVDH